MKIGYVGSQGHGGGLMKDAFRRMEWTAWRIRRDIHICWSVASFFARRHARPEVTGFHFVGGFFIKSAKWRSGKGWMKNEVIRS
jgi:hypothetical protein